MAKKTAKDAVRESKDRRAIAAAASQTASNAITMANREQDRQIKTLGNQLTAAKGKAAELGNKLLSTTDVSSRVQTDVLASVGAQGFNEGMNFLMRWLGEWSKKTEGDAGFLYRNVDFLQSLPGAVGTISYLIDTLLQKSNEDMCRMTGDAYIPSNLRLGFNKWAMLLSNLGLSNFVRALRYRWAESIDEVREKEETLAEQREALVKAKAEIEVVRRKLDEATKAAGGGR